MKLLHAVVSPLLVVVLAAVAWSFVPPFTVTVAPQEAQAPPAAKHEEGDTPLMTEMKVIETAEHFLRKSVGDASKDSESLKQIDLAQRAVLAAKLLPPKMAANVPEADRPKFLAEYRKMMAQLLIEFATCEKALLDGDREAAKASCRKLHGMEEDGHAEFTDGE